MKIISICNFDTKKTIEMNMKYQIILVIITSLLSSNPVLLPYIYMVSIILFCIYINVSDKKLNYIIPIENQIEILICIIRTMLKVLTHFCPLLIVLPINMAFFVLSIVAEHYHTKNHHLLNDRYLEDNY